MKVKLLKKIRKRFSISKIESVGIPVNEILNVWTRKFRFPFYRIDDDDDTEYWWPKDFYQTFQEAKDEILRMVIAEYRFEAIKETKIKL